ncbi:MAG TPA: hypothetical protein VJ793_27330 [Anaerolineae bacterium]|nr:hypothetical protein [Anaerolineae bacterium]
MDRPTTERVEWALERARLAAPGYDLLEPEVGDVLAAEVRALRIENERLNELFGVDATARFVAERYGGDPDYAALIERMQRISAQQAALATGRPMPPVQALVEAARGLADQAMHANAAGENVPNDAIRDAWDALKPFEGE